MSEEGRQWIGQLVDGKFPLQQFLGGGAHSAVFLTERSEEPKKAAIKLVQSSPEEAERQLFQWRLATKVPHPHLLRIFEAGQCELGGQALLYLVTEYAEENLAEVLAQRALTPAETRDLLKPLLDALAYLHSKGFVHGDLRPANILASADQLKLSADSICTGGTSRPREADLYFAPEQREGQLTPAADVWSLGMVLVEVLTGKIGSLDAGHSRRTSIGKEVPEPFAEIVRHCLCVDPQARWTVAEIKNHLEPRSVTPTVRAVPARARPFSKWLYIVPSIVLVLALLTLLRPHGRSTGPKAPPQAQKQIAPKPSATPASQAAAAAAPKASTRQPQQTPGAVLNRVLPQVPQKALDTITGRVKIAVRANVDESGKVVSTMLERSGPSKYFARLALQAAENWRFRAPQSNSDPLPSTWILHFTFTSTAVDASATRAH